MTEEHVLKSILECRKRFLQLDHRQCYTWENLSYIVEVLRLMSPLVGISKVDILDEVGCENANHEGYTKGNVAFHFEQITYLPQCAVEIYRKNVEGIRVFLLIGGRYLCYEPHDMHYAAKDIVSVVVERGKRSLIPSAFSPTTVLALFNAMKNSF